MRIWIVSSDPFYREFEKISEIWAEENEITITLISKYGYNLLGLWGFCSIFIGFKPNVVLTDHGYFGFWFVKKIAQLRRWPVKFNFFLRGNYWLEERIRNEKSI